MSSNINNNFVTVFQTEVTQIFQTLQSNLRDSVTVKTVEGGDTRFPVMAATAAVKNRARHSILAGDGDAHSYVTATLANYEAWRFIDSLDEFKVNFSARDVYAKSISASLNQSVDLSVIGAISAANQYTDTGLSAALDKAAFAKLRKFAGTNSFPKEGTRTMVLTPAAYASLFLNSEVTSRDWAEGRAFASGVTNMLMGFNVVESKELESINPSGTTAYGFIYHQNSVGLGIGKDITAQVNYSPAHNANIVLGEMSIGAVSILPTCIGRFTVTGL